ncbi:MAG: DEAD/DEAH box helicase family protein [Clostridia bacterium]|nr:DEAD/DEAH box helicase family protein [Clostridia bacterium]
MLAFANDKLDGLKDYLKDLISKKGISSNELLEAIGKMSSAHTQLQKEEANQEKQRQLEEKKLAEKKEAERVAQITSMDLPLDYENVFGDDVRAQDLNVQTVSDGMIASINVLGCVDIEFISQASGKSCKEVIQALKGSIYQNPNKWGERFYKGWEPADEYLSGNLLKKWRQAKLANEKYNGYFAENIKAIEKVLPKSVASQDIFITLGSPWVPTDVIDDFIEHLFGKSYASGREQYRVRHDQETGTWDIPEKTRYYSNAKTYSAYGTRRMPALYILEKTLNMRNVAVTDEVSCPTNKSGKKRVINQAETLSAVEKQKKLIDTFRSWVWQDKRRKERLCEIYEEKYTCYRTRRYDGSFLEFPTMNKNVKLRQHQKDAIARIIFSKNTLLAHDVGSGKTYVMISSGMELKRMGLSNKNLYVVPNNLVGQWKKMFSNLYPNANVLVVSPKDFTPLKRQETLAKIKVNDYDGIIMASSCFDLIPLSKVYYTEKFLRAKKRLEELEKQTNKNTSGVKAEKKRLQDEMNKNALESMKKDYKGITFDELGITRLYVDEAHEYKNLHVNTKASNVLGLNNSSSKKCQELLDKVRHVQMGNGGVIFATGTPITNSITDAFVMQYYLQYGELELLDLQSFDSWIGMFAEKQTEFEVDVDTSQFRLATRFSKFHNLPELTSILSNIADFHLVDLNDGLPKTDGYSDALIGKTMEFEQYLKKISDRADAVRNRIVKRTEDNMLKITTDGRKGALDLRLVEQNALFSYNSKVARCADNVADIYYRTMSDKCAQLVFCDSSTPKIGFNVYDELKRLLTLAGIPSNEIAYVHDATTEKKRNQLFKNVNQGDVRVLIGSTQKLGLGVNVQKRLVAVHHLDIPWRPADMVQREGRIVREGNMNKKVSIFRYITEGSFDAYSWQLLESKQRFICALLSGSIKERSGSDISDTILNYAEVKALAIGNPLIKKRVEIANELNKLYSLRRKYVESRWALQKELEELPQQIAQAKQRMDNCKEDAHFVAQSEFIIEKQDRQKIRKVIFDAVMENDEQEKDKVLLNYKGFDVVLPKNMSKERPFIYLQRVGRYVTEIGDVEKGVMIRIDNCLEGLQDRFVKLENAYQQLLVNHKNIKDELQKDENYDEKILDVQEQLEKIDKKLGVKKNG